MSEDPDLQDAPAESGDDPSWAGSTTDPGRSRRPSSLRTEVGGPSFPGSPHIPGSPVSESARADQGSGPDRGPVSEAAARGNRRQVPNPASLIDQLPVDRLPLAVDRAKTLFRERPEAGLGLAFMGGLIVATILRRLAR